MKLTLELNSYEEMNMHAKALDAFRVLDILHTNLANEARRLEKEKRKQKREGVLISVQMFQDLMEQYGLYGILDGLENAEIV